MSIKTYKPTTPSRRHMSVSGFDGVDKHAKPQKELVEVLKKHAGRNSYGRITVRHQGGGNRKKYRVIDFKRDKMDVTATVLRLEYDPNRSANIALVEYADGQRPAAGQHPGRHRDPQHRALPGQGCAAGPLRGRRRAAHGEGERHGYRPSPLRRVP